MGPPHDPPPTPTRRAVPPGAGYGAAGALDERQAEGLASGRLDEAAVDYVVGGPGLIATRAVLGPGAMSALLRVGNETHCATLSRPGGGPPTPLD
jgi:hypothetical protein